jgi:hypothetical protein
MRLAGRAALWSESMAVATRRTLLCAAAPLAFAAATTASAAVPGRSQRLTAIFADRRAAAELGLAVWPTLPAATTEDSLIEAILGRHAGLAELLAEGPPEALAAALRRAVDADFAAGRTHLVDGWVLARTEAELCALARLA